MPIVQVTLELKGHFAGVTKVLSDVQFTNGRVTLAGPQPEVESLSKYLFRCYQAVPVGTPWPPKEEGENGPDQIHESAGSGKADAVQAGVQPDGTGPAETGSNDGNGAAKTEADGSRSVPSGDGQPNPRIDTPNERFNSTSHSALNPEKLLKAMESLDHNNPAHWTQPGKPRVDAVEKFYGGSGLTRADLDAVWPELVRQ